jgi:hypothetical protein
MPSAVLKTLKKAPRLPEQVWSAFPVPSIEQDAAVK